jgi:hypothetical protein
VQALTFFYLKRPGDRTLEETRRAIELYTTLESVDPDRAHYYRDQIELITKELE